jgi:hypothetical protein
VKLPTWLFVRAPGPVRIDVSGGGSTGAAAVFATAIRTAQVRRIGAGYSRKAVE